MYMYIHRCNRNYWEERLWIWRRAGRGIWKGLDLEGGKGRDACCHTLQIAKLKFKKTYMLSLRNTL